MQQHQQRRQFARQIFRSDRFAVAFVFASALFVFEFFSFPLYYRNFYVSELFLSGVYQWPLKVFAMGLASFLLLILFVAAALLSPYRYRVIYFLLFCLGAVVEYGYQNAFNRFTNFEDAVNAFAGSDARMMSSYISSFYSAAALAPCLVFGILLILIRPSLKNGLKPLLVFLISFTAFFSLTAYFTSSVFPSVSFNAFCRTVVGLPVNWYLGSIHQPAFADLYYVPRRPVEFRAETAPRNNVVFIVDESVRGDRLSLNGYERATTPFLEELNRKGLIKNWGVGVSGTTCSINSNNLLLTGVNTLPDAEGEIFLAPTIFQYAKAAGYKTFYFDGQLSYRWLGKPADVETFDEWITADKLKNGEWHDVDAEIARRVREIVGSSTGNFIWINKFGVHWPYHPSYPAAEAKWLPTPDAAQKSSDSQTLLPEVHPTHVGDGGISEEFFESVRNSYDNAILYNSESFFRSLVGDALPPENTIFVYTSDHGQNLGEDRKLISHCSETPNEANVPLFIIADPRQLPAVADTLYRASHANLFPTLLDLMNVPAGESRKQSRNLSPSLFKARAEDSQPRVYFSGGLHSETSGRKNLFDK
jgi:glucan phosphoethanolaminetransferase (alkaline phosphatase superfamily)